MIKTKIYFNKEKAKQKTLDLADNGFNVRVRFKRFFIEFWIIEYSKTFNFQNN